MNIQIYQNYYLEEQKQYLDSAFIPYDNTENKEPQLREYPILKKLQQTHKDDDLWWGLTSWRWKEKVKIPGFKVIEFINNKPGHQLYHINYEHSTATKYKNIFVQGDLHHNGMMRYFERLCAVLGFEIDLKNRYDMKHYIICHNYVMHSNLWKEWIEFLDLCLQTSYQDESLNYYLMVETSPRYNQKIPNFSFVVERLIALFCVIKNIDAVEYFECQKHIPTRLR